MGAPAEGRASCARLESTPLFNLRRGATRGVRNSESERLARFVARGTETYLAGRSDWQWQQPRIVERHHETSSRRHPICSTERAFQLKLATSVIAHLFSEARSQERTFSKGRTVPRAARKSGSQDRIAPTAMAPKGAGLARVESRERDVAADNRSRSREGLRGCAVDSRALEPIAIAEGQEGGEPKPHWSSRARSEEQV